MIDPKPQPQAHRISRVEDRDRILAEALAHAEAQDFQYKVLPPSEPVRGRWKTPVAVAIFVLAAWIGFLPPGWLAGRDAPRPTTGDRDRGLRAAVFLQAQQVEAFRLREGRLPTHLSELPAQFADLVLVRSNNRVYQIRGRRFDGVLVVYDSSRPSPAFAAAAAWRVAGSTP
ncbi:MAG: hypothetical protein Q8N53_02450 [Longimicrobiales bacterium]|nr:hypothetical protein [Longimicrobiales bacterium]